MKPLKRGVYYSPILDELIVIHNSYTSGVFDKNTLELSTELVADIETGFFGRKKELIVQNTQTIEFVGKL